MKPLITVDEVVAQMDRARIYDLRWDLADTSKGRASYEAGHIPGAVFVDLDRDLSAEPGVSGRHPLPEVAEFAATLGRLGISPDSRIVVYDDVAGRIAARMWWMLRAIGHERVQLLDGGLRAWVEEGHGLERGNVAPQPSTYPRPDGFNGVVGHDQLDRRTLVDARAPERYRGDSEPVDPKAGHIPGAVNIPTDANLGDDGRFRPPSELSHLYDALPDRPVVSCGSGVTACHDALAMVVAGREMPDVYVGSFSEWSRRDLPVTIGSAP